MRSLNSVETLLGNMDFHTLQREAQIGVSCLNGNVLMCIRHLKICIDFDPIISR